jgi:oligopeptidase A
VNNPLLQIDSLPAFDQIEAAHARPALEKVLADNRSRLTELTAQTAPTFATLVAPVEELSYRLSRVWSPIGHLNAVANSAPMREAYNECVPLLTAYSSELGQNSALYAGYAYVLQHERETLDPAQIKVVENALRDFRLSGVDLPAEPKSRYRDVMQRLAQLGTKFSENVLDAGRAYTRSVTDGSELAGLPSNAIDRAAANAREANQPGWLFKLDQPTYMTVMTSAESEQLRRDIYEAWVTRGSELGPSAGRFDNGPIIAELLPLRHELARLLGFKNFADYALATRMAKSTKQVLSFLEDLARRCMPAAREEFSDLEEFAGRKLNAWDLAFYSERLQESRFKVSQEALRPYFPLPKVLAGLFALTQRLYGITVREHPGISVWHRSVRYYDLLDSRDDVVAGFYGRMRRGQILAIGYGAAHRTAGMQFHRSGGDGALAVDARRSYHALPRVRAWVASHADPRGISQYCRNQRRGVGRGRTAQPVHGKFRLAARSFAAHIGARDDRRTAAGGHAAVSRGHAHIQCGARYIAANRTGQFRFRTACEFRRSRGRPGR